MTGEQQRLGATRSVVSSARSIACVGGAIFLASFGCGGEDNLAITNVAPKGSVGGIVVDASTLTGLKMVKVSVIAGSSLLGPVDTDESGRFALADVPAGELIIDIVPGDLEAFGFARINASLSNAAGEFPLDNSSLSIGPIGLVPRAPKSQPFRVRLVNSEGLAAPSVQGRLSVGFSWIDLSGGQSTGKGTLTLRAQSDNDGFLNFVGVPDFAQFVGMLGRPGISDKVEVYVPPFDNGGDGVRDFLGKKVTYDALTITHSAVPTIVLDSDVSTLEVLAASIAALAGKQGPRTIGAAGPLNVVFNLPIVKEQTAVSLVDEQGRTVPDSAVEATVDRNQLSLSFSGLKVGAEYNLSLSVVGKVDEGLRRGVFSAPFFTKSDKDVTVASRRMIDAGAAVELTFSEPIGTGAPESNAQPIVFVGADLDGSGKANDSPGEVGFPSSTIVMTHAEPDPPGPVGLSGFSSVWTFPTPQAGAAAPGTTIELVFAIAGTPLTRADGRPIGKISTTMP